MFPKCLYIPYKLGNVRNLSYIDKYVPHIGYAIP